MGTFLLAELAAPSTNISVILPELVVAAAGVIVMLYDSFMPRQRAVTGAISIVALVIAGVLLANLWGGNAPASSWGGMIANDNLRLSFSFVFLFVTLMTVLISTIW